VNAALLGLCGAGGGSLRTVVDLYYLTTRWQAERQARLDSPADAGTPPRPYREAVAIGPQLTVGLFLTVIGAALATILGLSDQISGGYAAVCVGISAPALLGQLGALPPVESAVQGGRPEAEPAPPLPDLSGADPDGAA
jgi:hypothetical protein